MLITTDYYKKFNKSKISYRKKYFIAPTLLLVLIDSIIRDFKNLKSLYLEIVTHFLDNTIIHLPLTY